MATAPAKRVKPHLRLGPGSAGILLTLKEFDEAEFEEGSRYELIRGVLIVSPSPLEEERDPNGELEYLLRTYRDTHPQGAALNRTLFEQTVRTRHNRRRVDRVIWASLGRKPRRGETPTIVIEFVSAGKKDYQRDYEEKRDEYREIKVKEYWIIDRFRRTMTVYLFQNGRTRKRVVRANQTYTTDLLPGFELPLGRLFTLADDWAD
jgi:Uma2 family endonuclease